ncbi:predicted protein [Plenodomus lingam JN3]|uniref:Uncharacterized protein n=1 Tax=Leptosphaeria maculans (strain JN3 / isolate v23.1.3 / race Av1-4-5-6-7-8) TaxID=985895 RepID=E5A749_LEPMJ|nr:predicted protein [Plenodomus lingam JN3]CBX99444.1 predicted protein [Plenodomus lingam JN3]
MMGGRCWWRDQREVFGGARAAPVCKIDLCCPACSVERLGYYRAMLPTMYAQIQYPLTAGYNRQSNLALLLFHTTHHAPRPVPIRPLDSPSAKMLI